MRTVAIVLITIVCIIGATVLGFYLHFYYGTFSAKQKPGWLETTLVRHAQKLAMPRDAKDLKDPYTQTPDMIKKGIEHFGEDCAVCHGVDGKGQTEIGKNVYPKVPDVTKHETQKMSDGEIYYTIANGVRFSAMPSFSSSHNKDELWTLVTFVRHLPNLTPEEAQAVKRAMQAGEREANEEMEHEMQPKEQK